MKATEDQTRRKNLRISGLVEGTKEKDDHTLRAVRKLVDEKLAAPNVKVAKAYRANRSSSNINSWQVIAFMMSESDKFCCPKMNSKLKSISLYLNDDVSGATMAIRTFNLPELYQKRRERFIAYFSVANIICRPNRTYGNA